MACSRLFLGATYSHAQYVGATVVCVGIFVVLMPEMQTQNVEKNDNGHNQVIWAGVLMLSCIPSVMSSVYKEMALQVLLLIPCPFEASN